MGFFWGSSNVDWQAPLASGDSMPSAIGGCRALGVGTEPLRGGTWALASAAQPATATCVKDGALLAAIQGDPRWVDGARASRAREIGHARALLEAFREQDATLLDGLRGAFSLAVLDTERDEALLAIDRYGIGTLCYRATAPGSLAFATTVDALRAFVPQSTTISTQAIYDFFYFVDKIPAPGTIFKEISKLPPAHCLHLKDGRISVRAYWRAPAEAGPDKDERWYAEQLMERLRAAVASSMERAPFERTGCFLSGGLDSSTVLGLFAAAGTGGARSFTIGFEEDGYDESAYAALAAESFGSQHDNYTLEPEDVFSALPRIAACYDEPFANSSCLPAYYCALRAKESGVSLLLAGDGGDELFAGNARYIKDRVFDPYAKIPGLVRRGLIEPVFDGIPAIAHVPILRKLRNYAKQARLSVPERMQSGNLFNHFRADQVFSRETLEEVNESGPLALLEEIYEAAAPAAKVRRMMQIDMRVTLADSDLRKVSRMCALAGVEVSFPFLDDDLVAFAATIPSHLLMKDGVLRGFYKQAVSGLLPQAILEKEKKGFGLPYVPLLARYGPLRGLARDCLDGLAARGWFAEPFLADMKTAMSDVGQSQVTGYVWDLLVLELWCRAHVDTAPGAIKQASTAVGAAF